MLVAPVNKNSDADIFKNKVGSSRKPIVVRAKEKIETTEVFSHDAFGLCVLGHRFFYPAVIWCCRAKIETKNDIGGGTAFPIH